MSPDDLQEFIRESYNAWARCPQPGGGGPSSSGASSSTSLPTAVGVVAMHRDHRAVETTDELRRRLEERWIMAELLDRTPPPNRDRGGSAEPDPRQVLEMGSDGRQRLVTTPNPRISAPSPKSSQGGQGRSRAVPRGSPTSPQPSSGNSWVHRINEDQVAEERADAAASLTPAPRPTDNGDFHPDLPVWITTFGERYHLFEDCMGIAESRTSQRIPFNRRNDWDGPRLNYRTLCGYCEGRRSGRIPFPSPKSSARRRRGPHNN